jgi:hypothetical protein
MKNLINESVDKIMEQHFDSELIDDLRRCNIIACKKGFKLSTQVALRLELEALVKNVVHMINNVPRD